MSSGVACSPAEMAVAPAPTRAGVLGMVRMMRTPCPTLRSTAASGTPAAMEMTSLESSRAGAISTSTLFITCGFTESTTMAASWTAARLSVRGADAVALLQLGEPVLAPVGEEDLRGRGDAGAQQALHEGLGHVAGAEEGDGLSEWHGRHSSR